MMKELINKKTVIILLHSTIICLAAILPALGQEKEVDLKDKRITLKVEKLPIGAVLGYLMEAYDISIGFEQSNLDRGQPGYKFSANKPTVAQYKVDNVDGVLKINPQMHRGFRMPSRTITVNFEKERLEEVFNQIVEQLENYKWEINDGVVNVFPIKGRDERSEKLLGTNIRKFILEKDKTVGDIMTNIESLPEFADFIRKNNLLFVGLTGGPEGALQAQYGRKLDQGMDFSNLTFRDLLNKITRNKRGAWILMWTGASKTTGQDRIDIDI